ncbi:hypothetical protein PVAP13_8KG337700 [Panicum virgatum]|uniref:PGG domain-containing protein n=1 Tax=Panicum virgatum TaxID=38727 RepID=A0A8T0PQ36_PANVG|nr:hypothetical protein PVAP13_8KG337700 [Panicum virgatum]
MDTNNQQSLGSTEYQLKKYLLLLATLVATVTYAAGLLAGGLAVAGRAADRRRLHPPGDQLQALHRLLLLQRHRLRGVAPAQPPPPLPAQGRRQHLPAPHAGGDARRRARPHGGLRRRRQPRQVHHRLRRRLVSGVSLYAVVAFLTYFARHPPGRAAARPPAAGKLGKKHEILLVLAIFAATNAYVAGLNPPGGFWRSTEEGHRAAGDPVLQGAHPRRYKAFFFCNTAASPPPCSPSRSSWTTRSSTSRGRSSNPGSLRSTGSSSRRSWASAAPTPPGAAGTASTAPKFFFYFSLLPPLFFSRRLLC